MQVATSTFGEPSRDLNPSIYVIEFGTNKLDAYTYICLEQNSKLRPKANLHEGGGLRPPPTKGAGRSHVTILTNSNSKLTEISARS